MRIPNEERVMSILSVKDNKPLTVSEIASKLFTDDSTVRKALSRLLSKGKVRRDPEMHEYEAGRSGRCKHIRYRYFTV